MTANDQLTLFRLILGEPDTGADARFADPKAIKLLNLGRNRFAERSRSFQIKDSQTTVVGTKFYTVKNDAIGFYEVEYDGVPLDPVEPRDWRDTIGDDDALQGTPEVYKYFARQLQLFRAPSQAKTLRYEGWGYPAALLVNGSDADYLDRQGEASVYFAAAIAKAADERESSKEEAIAEGIAQEFKRQYAPKGARYVRQPGTRTNRLVRWLAS